MKSLTKRIFPAIAISIGVFANCFAEYEVKVVASDAAANDQFGWSVATDGDYAIVGAQTDDDGGSSSGSAYIYNRSGTSWSQQAKIVASDDAANDNFGYSVALQGDFAVIGSRLDDDGAFNTGSVYVFKRSGTSWNEDAKITHNDPSNFDEFGYSVGIDGNYIVVGSRLDDDGAFNTGAAYVFFWNGTTWTQQAKLTANDPGDSDNFGYSVSISGDYVVVGSYLDDDDGDASGSAYIFKRSGTSWSQEAKLTANDGAANDNFGFSVSISGDYAAIGSNLDDVTSANSGSVYIFKRSGTSWSQEAKVNASAISAQDNFGYSVSLKGDFLAVGAINDDDGAGDGGCAYVFKRDGVSWTQESKYVADDAASADRLGWSISCSDNYVISGSRLDDDAGNSSGSAYIFGKTPFINSNVSQTVSSNTTVSFNETGEDTGIDIAFTGVSNSGDVQCESYPETPTGTTGINGTAQPVRWVLSDGGLAFTNAELRIDLDTLPFTLEFPEAATIYHRSTPGSGSFSGLATTLDGNELVANTPSFSEFALGGGDEALAIELDSFTARQIENTIQLNWTTASETENEGFIVYRKKGNGSFTQIASYKGNQDLVGALNSSVSNDYTFVDDSKFKSNEFYTYYISDVETNGVETKHEDQAQTVKFTLNEEIAQTKLDYVLAQNFPNPFNPSTTINFQIAKEQSVKLEVYNLKGKLVKELVNNNLSKGSHSANWNGTDSFGNQVSSGTYFYKISAGTFTQTNKMILLK